MYSASIEWICEHAGIIRLHDRPGGKLGDPYQWLAVLGRKGTAARVCGVSRPISKAGITAVAEELYRQGMRSIVQRRLGGGRDRTITRPIATPKAER
jgi:hypothetical protein